MQDGSRRRLAAILSADVAGYSRLMGGDEAGTLAQLKRHRSELWEPKFAEHGGRLVGEAGDSVLVEFPSVVEAVRCAAEIQREMTRRNAATPAERRMLLRIGINLGDVIADGATIFGDGVNIAARLQALAEPGGICVSGGVHDQVKSKLPFTYRSRGLQTVKNIAEPIQVYGVDTEGAPASPAGRARTKRRWVFAAAAGALAAFAVLVLWAALPQLWGPEQRRESEADPAAKPAIAVLPFANQSGDPEQEYFSDGITEDVIGALGRFSSLAVIARNSVFAYKGKTVKPDELGRELGVRYVVEGSVRKMGDRVRVTVQLTESAKGVLLWSERYEENLRDIFALQDKITRQIAGALAIKLTRLEQDRALATPTENLEAYDYVLRGREQLSRFTRAQNREAQGLFEQALALDPGYAAAYAALGWSHMHAFWFGWTERAEEALQRAHDLAQKAIGLEESNAAAHGLLGTVYLYRTQYDLAVGELDRAIELNPNDANSYISRGRVMLGSGRTDEAVQALETALRFDPNIAPDANMQLGFAYYLKGRYDDSIRTLERGLGRHPDFAYLHVALAAAYAQAGRAEDARREAAAVRRLLPFFEVDSFGDVFRNPRDRASFADGLRKAGLD